MREPTPWCYREKCSLEISQKRRQLADSFNRRVGRSSAKPLRHRRSAEHADGAHSRAMRHLDVFWRITDIHANLRREVEPVERHAQRCGMRLSPRGVLTAHLRAKH